jgi:hypothetical protein
VSGRKTKSKEKGVSWRPGAKRVLVSPYDILFGDGEHAAFVGPFTVTFTGPLELSDGTVIEPIGNAFEAVFSTIASPAQRYPGSGGQPPCLIHPTP